MTYYAFHFRAQNISTIGKHAYGTVYMELQVGFTGCNLRNDIFSSPEPKAHR